jgi:hypothetical protein
VAAPPPLELASTIILSQLTLRASYRQLKSPTLSAARLERCRIGRPWPRRRPWRGRQGTAAGCRAARDRAGHPHPQRDAERYPRGRDSPVHALGPSTRSPNRPPSKHPIQVRDRKAKAGCEHDYADRLATAANDTTLFRRRTENAYPLAPSRSHSSPLRHTIPMSSCASRSHRSGRGL